MPKRLTDEQRGPLATWIVRQREARGWKQESMPDRLADAGYGVRGDYYRQVEAGKKPGPDFLAALERVFETRYVEPQPELDEQGEGGKTTPDLALLLARLDAQARTIDTLAASITQLARAVAALTGTELPGDELAQAVESAALVTGRIESGPAAASDLRVVPPAGTTHPQGR